MFWRISESLSVLTEMKSCCYACLLVLLRLSAIDVPLTVLGTVGGTENVKWLALTLVVECECSLTLDCSI